MRKIKRIVIHCSATKEGKDFDVNDMERMHLNRGFNEVGYHFVIKLDGTIQKGRDVLKMGAHARGDNEDTIGICYIGGLDKKGKAKDTRTTKQISSMLTLLDALRTVFNIEDILGHRDLSPDLDGDGIIEPHEWLKQCPCFDAKDEYKFLIKKS